MVPRWSIFLVAVLVLPLAAAASTVPPTTDAEVTQARALLKSGGAHEEAGRLDQAAADYATALSVAERTPDRDLQATALAAVGYLQYYRGDMDQALANFRRAYDLAVASGDAGGQSTMLGYIAGVYADAKVAQYDRAIEYYQQVLAHHEAAGKAANVADTLFNIASTLERKGDHATALEWYQRALAAEQTLGRTNEAAFVERSIGVTLAKLGRPAEALPRLDHALAVLAEGEDRDRAMMTRQSRGVVLRELGRLPQAIADLEASRAWFEANHSTRFLEKSEAELALAYAAAGRWREAYDARSRHAALQLALSEKAGEENSARLRVQFDSARTEQENRALTRDKAAAERIRDLQRMVLVLGVVLLVLLGLFTLRQMRDARRLREMAMTDELTRLPNRRHLLSGATQLIQQVRATDQALSLIAIDIDHFKQINDKHGHAAGDAVLQRVAHTCRMTLRPTDLVGRTGGEEFTAMLPATDKVEAQRAAERVRRAVEQMSFADIDPALRVTLSLGVASWNNNDSLGTLWARADERLYQAKEQGRNRVVPASG